MGSTKVVQADVALKRPTTAYWLWLGDNREAIVKKIGTSKGPEVAKKAGEMWKALSAKQRQPYEQKAKDQKDAYEKYIATEEGKKALGEKKSAQAEARAEKKEKNEKKECRAAVQAIEKDEALKKPKTAYWLWLGDNRQRIAAMLGSGKGSEVASKGGEMWGKLSSADKKPYEKKAQEEKEAYEKYIASEEGAAKLKAYKEAAKEAKDQVKGTKASKGEAEESEAEEEEESSPKTSSPMKRAKASEDTAAPPSKKAKTAVPKSFKAKAATMGA